MHLSFDIPKKTYRRNDEIESQVVKSSSFDVVSCTDKLAMISGAKSHDNAFKVAEIHIQNEGFRKECQNAMFRTCSLVRKVGTLPDQHWRRYRLHLHLRPLRNMG